MKPEKEVAEDSKTTSINQAKSRKAYLEKELELINKLLSTLEKGV